MNEIKRVLPQRSSWFSNACSGVAVIFSFFGGTLAGFHLDLKTHPYLDAVSQKHRPGFKAGLPDLDTTPNPLQTDFFSVDTQPLIVANGLSTQVPRPKALLSQGRGAETVELVLSSSLSEDQQRVLSSLLLGEPPATVPFLELSPPRRQPTPAEQAHLSKRRAAAILARLDPAQVVDSGPGTLGKMEVVSKVEVEGEPLGKCGLGFEHRFEKPLNDPAENEDLSQCPAKATWLSKSKSHQGWVKLEGPGIRTTLTYHPAPSNGATLLLDDVWVHSIAIRTGLKITPGMGAVAGIVPKGYKIEFTGRSEETQYFEANRRRYFLILNVEPGSGVIELVADQSQDQNATVFVPVLQDVTTYLDLSTPVTEDIGVRIVKNARPGDPDVVGLTVGLSTHSGFQAITRSNGTAILAGVKRVRGYPVFVDVSSKSGESPGVNYRYELKAPAADGHHHLDQIADKSLQHWLRQVAQPLSDQSAMIVGVFDKNRMNGFRSHYTAKAGSLSQNPMFDPVNYSILWDGTLSEEEPLEGDLPRFMAVQVPEGLAQIRLSGDEGQILDTALIPVSPRVIHVVSE